MGASVSVPDRGVTVDEAKALVPEGRWQLSFDARFAAAAPKPLPKAVALEAWAKAERRRTRFEGDGCVAANRFREYECPETGGHYVVDRATGSSRWADDGAGAGAPPAFITLVACDAGSGPHSRGGAGDGGDGTSGGCPNTVLTEGYNWGDGAWATYIEAAVWANMALNGEATYRLHSEGVLGILVMLFGFILLGFLLGELTNTIAAALHARTRGAGGAGGAAPSDDHIFRFLLKHFATRAAANAKEAADADAWEAANPRYAALCHALYDSMQDGGPYADAYFVRGAPAASPDSSDTESGTGAVQPGAGDAESDDDDAGAG